MYHVCTHSQLFPRMPVVGPTAARKRKIQFYNEMKDCVKENITRKDVSSDISDDSRTEKGSLNKFGKKVRS